MKSHDDIFFFPVDLSNLFNFLPGFATLVLGFKASRFWNFLLHHTPLLGVHSYIWNGVMFASPSSPHDGKFPDEQNQYKFQSPIFLSFIHYLTSSTASFHQ